MIIAGLLNSIGYRPDTIVHVGAHLAEEREAYQLLGVARIMWIEADPDLAQRLRNLIGDDPREIVIEALVLDEDGRSCDFHRFSNDGASSSVFRATALLGEKWPHVQQTGEVLQLASHRLDVLLDAAGMAPGQVDVLVFDIQGAEILAMTGSGAYLAGARYVEIEVSEEAIYAGAPLAHEVEAFLEERGFVRISERPWHGDVVFRRRDVASR